MNHDTANLRTPLRLWPGLVAAALLLLVRFVLPAVAPGAELFGVDAALMAVIGGLLFAIVIALWWLLFSRAPWSDRLAAVGAMALAIFAIKPFIHISIEGGLMGRMYYIYAVPPTLGLALVAWAAATRRLSNGLRRATLVLAMLIGCGVWTLARTDGLIGGIADLEWRWTPTAEELLLAQTSNEPPLPSPAAAAEIARQSSPAPAAPITPAAPTTPATTTPAAPGAHAPAPAAPIPPAAPTPPGIPFRAEWPGFRGAARDGVVRGVSIKSDWSASPPVEMWRRPVGPGWSSFAVNGDLFYTQEQRGDDEIVACYRVSTGEPVWRHRDPARFYESNGGAGPRSTPTLDNGRVYTFGATGIVNALDASTGKVLWSRNAATDTKRRVPEWGFTSSPLVIDDVVIVAASGSMVGYDAATGNPRWVGPRHLGSYSSPHRATIDGVVQVVLLSGSGAAGLAPATGTLLWEQAWPDGGTVITQPATTPDGDILINSASAMGGLGTRRLHISQGGDGWKVEERWTSRGLKPYFNDFVVHEGHAYGFDGNILASINLEDGVRKWKGGRFGNGQLVLLADQDLLLVLSEEGELALVSATPDKFTEVARFRVLEGKTWNHPVLVGDVLLVRNGEEMAALRMPVVRSTDSTR